MYQEGEGSLEPDDRLASRKFEGLAYYGDPASQLEIGYAYMSGAGVPENEALGFMWLERAAANRSSDAIIASLITSLRLEIMRRHLRSLYKHLSLGIRILILGDIRWHHFFFLT